ncbi:MAG TPA: nitrilase-related carbon-nitrogen hydrolase [Gemmatimonadaceae bacterium]|jgi:predicted amidohydrolase|nr:nitrilase-related carbon-nitrogen hydrolase [Gemmatimonadaceae bacterium]
MSQIIQAALIQFQPAKGDYPGNLAHLEQAFETITALDPRPNVITLPETALTGYFLEGGVRDLARSAEAFAADLNQAWRKHAPNGTLVDIVAGFYELYRDAYYNSALYATLGGDTARVVHVHRKVFLPTYGMFDEERFVDHGLEIRAFDTRWGRAAILICEDAWHGITATAAALDGAQIVFIPSASPARGAWPQPDETIAAPASLHRWTRLARDRAEEHGVYVIVTQLVGNEGGKAFAGGSIVTGPMGDVRTQGPLWQEAVLPVTLDLHDIARARAETPLLSDLRTILPHMIRSLRRTCADETATDQ